MLKLIRIDLYLFRKESLWEEPRRVFLCVVSDYEFQLQMRKIDEQEHLSLTIDGKKVYTLSRLRTSSYSAASVLSPR